MIGLLISLLVVFCGIYCVLWVIGVIVGLFNAAWRTPIYPFGGPYAVGSWVSFAVALTIWIVLGHHSMSSL